MPVETKYKTFKLKDGTELNYLCEQMPATLSSRTLVQLTDIVGTPSLVAISQMFGKDGLDTEIDSIARTVASMIMSKLTPEKADELIMASLQGVRCEGVKDLINRGVFDQHFRGRILHLYSVVGWSISVNYADFLDVATSNPVVSNALTVLTEGSKLLTQTLKSGLSAQQKADST